jgi:aromatic-L-amino-acid decarboxylase
VCFNPHKWLLTNFDCTCFWTSDRTALIGAMSITPEYLRNAASDSGSVIDYRDWQVPLGRRFRALKLWFVLRHYGLEGLRAYLREHVRLGEMFEGLVRSDERFEVVAPRVLNLVCFRLKGEGAASDARNRALMDRVNAGGGAFLTHTVLPEAPGRAARLAGRVVLRAVIGSARTEERHVLGLWESMCKMAES